MKYEYKNVNIDFTNLLPHKRPAGYNDYRDDVETKLNEVMNEMTKDGWEYYSSICVGTSQYAVLVFRRSRT